MWLNVFSARWLLHWWCSSDRKRKTECKVLNFQHIEKDVRYIRTLCTVFASDPTVQYWHLIISPAFKFLVALSFSLATGFILLVFPFFYSIQCKLYIYVYTVCVGRMYISLLAGWLHAIRQRLRLKCVCCLFTVHVIVGKYKRAKEKWQEGTYFPRAQVDATMCVWY